MAATNILHRGRVSLVIVIHSSVTDKPRRKKAIAKIKKIASRTNDHWIKTGTATKALELKKKTDITRQPEFKKKESKNYTKYFTFNS